MSKRPRTLGRYYGDHYPVRLVWEWITWAQGTREVAFEYESGAYSRYNAFRSAEKLKGELQRTSPAKIDFGAVYKNRPQRDGRIVGRELVIDIDISDYTLGEGDDKTEIRTCCRGAKICPECWKLMDVAVAVIDRMLREDFGFEHILWVFSGRRGVHCWVCDPRAFMLDDISRRAICDHLGRRRECEEITRGFPTIQCLNTTDPLDIYPRLDENVTRQSNHLLKAPFCAHPKTGKICVPFDPTEPFDPFSVPGVDAVAADGGECLKPYCEYMAAFTEALGQAQAPDDPLTFDKLSPSQ